MLDNLKQRKSAKNLYTYLIVKRGLMFR